MPENTFDIVSKVDLQEVSNAIQQALKEIHTRFDLKDSKSDIQLDGKEALVLHSADEYKLKAVNDVLQGKLVKRGVPLKGLTYGTIEPAAGSTVRQRVTMQQGITDRKGARDREGDQELEEEGAGLDPGRFGSRQRQRPRYTAGNHGAAASKRISASTCSSRTTDQLTETCGEHGAFEHTGRHQRKRNFRPVARRPRRHRTRVRARHGFERRAITEIGEYLRAGGGKRLRPALLLLSCKLLDYQGPGAVKLGAVVEIIHTATLVHDDIIDEAQTRRGRPAANTQWGNSKCVLAGDWLYMQAFKIAVQERNFHILDTLIDLTQRWSRASCCRLKGWASDFAG